MGVTLPSKANIENDCPTANEGEGVGGSSVHPEVLMAADTTSSPPQEGSTSMNLQSVLPALKPHLHFKVQGFAEPCNRVQY